MRVGPGGAGRGQLVWGDGRTVTRGVAGAQLQLWLWSRRVRAWSGCAERWTGCSELTQTREWAQLDAGMQGGGATRRRLLRCLQTTPSPTSDSDKGKVSSFAILAICDIGLVI